MSEDIRNIACIVPDEFKPDWINADTCIENAVIAYDDSLCMRADDPDDDPIPVDTTISSGDLSVIIGLANAVRRAKNLVEVAVRNGHTDAEILDKVLDRLAIKRADR